MTRLAMWLIGWLTLAPWQRPSPITGLGNHEKRIRALERALREGGWRFDVDNEGGSGYVQTNDDLDLGDYPDPLAVGGTWGLVLVDESGAGMLIGADLAEVLIKSRGGDVSLLADGVPVAAARFVELNVNGTGSAVHVNLLTAGTAFVVNDHLNNPIFRVDEDGTLHGLTGAPGVIFDL